MTDVLLPTRIRRLARIVRAERRVTDAVAAALGELADTARAQLAADGWTATAMDNRAPEWRTALAARIMPVIADVFTEGFRAETRDPALTAAVMPSGEPLEGSFGMADHLATRYLSDVNNRMVGVADDVFRVITDSLEEGRQAQFTYTNPTTGETTTTIGESIPELAKRVNAALTDGQRWRNRGTVVARTEVIGANNAGSHAAAYANAELFGESSTAVIKGWLATHDTRTRETHRNADGQNVMGLDTPFQVGGANLQQPGDPSGPAGEVIQCRCTALYHYPGDPGYDDLAASLGAPVAAPAPEPAPAAPSALQAGIPASEEPVITNMTEGLTAGKYSASKLRAKAATLNNEQAVRNVDEAIRRHEVLLAERAGQPFAARKFTGAADTRDWADAHWGPAGRYTPEQIKAVREYTGSGYGPMNTTLRNSKGKRSNKLIDAMDSAIEDAPRVPEDLQLVRSTNLRQLGITKTRVSVDDLRDLVGAEFQDHGYMSTSLSSRTSVLDKTNNVRLVLRARPGTRGIYVSGGQATPKSQILSDFGKGETELILARGTGFRVLNVKKAGDGWVVEAELIQEKL